MHQALADINYLFIFVTAMIALICLGERDKLAVYIFCFLCTLYGLVEGYIPNSLGFLAYVGSALTSFIIIRAIYKYIRPTRFIIKVQTVCICLIAANVFGWVAFMAYFSPICYTALCTTIYLGMLIITGGQANAIRNIAMDGGNTSVPSNHNTFNHDAKGNKKEAGN